MFTAIGQVVYNEQKRPERSLTLTAKENGS